MVCETCKVNICSCCIELHSQHTVVSLKKKTEDLLGKCQGIKDTMTAQLTDTKEQYKEWKQIDADEEEMIEQEKDAIRQLYNRQIRKICVMRDKRV